MIYITEYSVNGSRCCGLYLVNASSKKEANTIVKAFDEDYTRIKSHLVEHPENLEHDDNVVVGCHVLDLMDEDDLEKVKQPGIAINLVSGT